MIRNKKTNKVNNQPKNAKDIQLDQFRVDSRFKDLTTNQGLKLTEDEFSLKAGVRGPTLILDTAYDGEEAIDMLFTCFSLLKIEI